MQELIHQAAEFVRETTFIINWNPRRAPVEAIDSQSGAYAATQWTLLHSDKREHIYKEWLYLARLPSGKFDTNYLVCQLAAVAMNLLRVFG